MKHLVGPIVAETCLPNPENKRDVNHKDGNKWNNCVWNLEWATVHENNKHAVDNGLLPYMPKYSEDQIRHVCELLCSGKYNNRQISDMTGVGHDIVSRIKRGNVWCRISQEYLDRFKYYDFSCSGETRGELPDMTARTKTRIMENMKNSIYRKF